MREVTRGERFAVVLAAIAVMAVTMIPYVVALQLPSGGGVDSPVRPGDRFGGFIWGVDDGNVYLSWIRQASEGHLLLRNQYTTDPQNPHFFNLFLMVAGLICRITGLAPIVVFHVLRMLGGIFAFSCLYWLIAQLTDDRWIRWGALGLAALGSGLGWIVVMLGEAGTALPLQPVDVGVNWQVQPEAVTFVSALLNPLFIISMGLICLVFGHALRALEDRSIKSAVVAGVLLLVLGNIHSYDIFAIHVTLGLWILYGIVTRRYELKQAAISYGVIFALGLPAPLWSYWAAKQDPSYIAKAMTSTPSAGFANYLVAYGLLAVFGLVGAITLLKKRQDNQESGTGEALLKFLVFWVVANSAALALPLSFQRKLVEGLHMPIAMLAAVGVVWLGRKITAGANRAGKLQTVRERMALTIIGAIVICVPSNALLVGQCIENVKTNNLRLLHVLAPPVYLTEDYAAAAEWLGAVASDDDVVLCSSLFGSHVPAAAKCTVYAGHWAETLHFSNKLSAVQRFYGLMGSPEEKMGVLQQTGADYVVAGPWEWMVVQDAVGRSVDDMQQESGGMLEPVFASGEVIIYEVTQG